jgi:tetratricopeptide (TPR) repeat protein
VAARPPSLASFFQEHDERDELTEASNAVVDMVHAGNLDAAEQAAHDLLARFPDVHDGYDRLGMVCEARGEHRQAADCYRKAINVIRNHPDNYDPEFEAVFQRLIDRLEPKADAPAA